MTRPQDSLKLCSKIISDFEASLSVFHGISDYDRGLYYSINRKGCEERIPLLSLSIGIVSTEFYKIASYAQLASIATEVKRVPKAQIRSSIVRDRRIMALDKIFMPNEELPFL
ncbi:MAG: hypothetical protein AB1442_10690 [Nitrospirota bacterium]